MMFYKGLNVFLVFALLLLIGFSGCVEPNKVVMIPFYPKEAEFDSVLTSDLNANSITAKDFFGNVSINLNWDGGSANSIYLTDQFLEGGFAHSTYSFWQYCDGGGA